MTIDQIFTKRRQDLIRREPIFRQQSTELQKMGNMWAAQEPNADIKRALRNIDMVLWDETENLLRLFSRDLTFAPYYVQTYLTQVASRGAEINLELQLPSMVAAFTLVRISAGGGEVREKHKGLMRAIKYSQKTTPAQFDYFNDWCTLFQLNQRDPSTGQETIYRRGDPMERLRPMPEEEADKALREAMLEEVLQATRGWQCPEAFGPYWEQWQALWRHLVEQDALARQLARKCPRGQSNTTPINIRLVAGVAGLMLRHLRSHRLTTITDKRMAEFIRESWSSDECRKSIGGADGLTREQVRQTEGWMNINVH